MTRLKIGAKAPDFTATTSAGDDVTLSSYQGKLVWVGFYRYSGCQLCNLRISEEIEYLRKKPLKDAVKLTIMQSSAEKVKQFLGKQNPPFAIITDPKMELYKLYGLESSKLGMIRSMLGVSRFMKAIKLFGLTTIPSDGDPNRMPADFLIDKNGVIKDVYYASVGSSHIPFERIDDFLGADYNEEKRAA